MKKSLNVYETQPIIIAVATRAVSANSFSERPIAKSLDKLISMHTNVDVKLCTESEGLPKFYNSLITEENRDKILVFMHDDIIIEDLWFVDKLINSPYDISALAGSASFNPEKSQHLAWHLCAERNELRGEVAHIKDGKVWTSVFGPYGRVLMMDGLFIACKCSTLLDKDVKFDEDFKYHFYDLSFSLRCHNAQVVCGVLPIRVVHFGLGDSMNSTEWSESNNKFREKYCTPAKSE